MATYDPFSQSLLRRQIEMQKKYSWDIDRAFDWSKPLELDRYFLPLDKKAILFPWASEEQRLVLSQFMGLIVNATISETEEIIEKLKDTSWTQVLDGFPINPEMRELGELFFQEEIKHSKLFQKFNNKFCADSGVDPQDLHRLMPHAFNTKFLKQVISNANHGGHVFWWVVAFVEEVSIELYKCMKPFAKQIDPLFYQVHLKHLEEEARHSNYAFLMLELVHQKKFGLRSFLHRKLDLFKAQIYSNSWILSELARFEQVRQLKKKHEFFAILASCLPHLTVKQLVGALKEFYIQTPYINLILNSKNHPRTVEYAQRFKALSLPLPQPQAPELGVTS